MCSKSLVSIVYVVWAVLRRGFYPANKARVRAALASAGSYGKQRVLFGAIVLVVIGSTPSRAAAPYRPKVEPVVVNNGSRYNVSPEYNLEEAYAGNKGLLLTVAVETVGRNNLRILSCKTDEDDRRAIEIEDQGSPGTPQSAGGVEQLRYTYRVKIHEDSDPRSYQITLELKSPDGRTVKRTFPLNVGVLDKSMLAVVGDGAADLKVITGQENPLSVMLHNDFHDYSVNIHRVRISSDPAGIVESRELLFDPAIVVGHSQEPYEIPLRVAGMSLVNVILGYNDPKLVVKFSYDDGNSRSCDYVYQKKLKISPSAPSLFFFIFLGVALGVALMIDLRRLQQAGLISATQKVRSMVVTAAVGVIVSLIAIVGDAEIVWFKLHGSYEKPILLLVIALASTFWGRPILYSFLKLPAGTAEAALKIKDPDK